MKKRMISVLLSLALMSSMSNLPAFAGDIADRAVDVAAERKEDIETITEESSGTDTGSDGDIEFSEIQMDEGQEDSRHGDEPEAVSFEEDVPAAASIGEEIGVNETLLSEADPSDTNLPEADPLGTNLQETSAAETETEPVPEGFSEENGLTVFSQENADLLYTQDDPEGQKLVEEIQEGEMIALAITEDTFSGSFSSRAMAAAASSAKYQLVVEDYVEVDELTKREKYRKIVYTDGNGKERSSPIYCMNASKDGIKTQDLKTAAVKALKNSTIQKLLYFGYGGPGDIGDSYDPTCSHIRWSRWQNRYIFTHMAISKVYANDYGLSSEAEYEHAGVNRFLAKIKSLTIPARDGVVFQTADAGWNQTAKRNQTVYFGFVKAGTSVHTWDWVDKSVSGYSQGFMVSDAVRMIDTGKANNTIKITRPANASWQLGYWRSDAEYQSRGDANPRILQRDASVTVRDGYVFRIVMPESFATRETWKYSMSLSPVAFLFVDGSIQTGADVQDFGAYVYQGTPATASLELVPDVPGTLTVSKQDAQNGGAVSGAVYGLYAAGDIFSRASLQYASGELVAQGTTDQQGQIVFSWLVPGNYVLREMEAPAGYLPDTVDHPANVQAGSNWLTVLELPDIGGRVSVRKVDRQTGAELEDAEFLLYSWDKNQGIYTNEVSLPYDIASKTYTSEIRYTLENEGKFRIVETKNPTGYGGQWSQDISFSQNGQVLSYTVENEPLIGEITVVKKIRSDDIIWAHGNPTFHFSVSGKDLFDRPHTYEAGVSFVRDAFSTDENGYGTMQVTIPNVPLGTYQITEKPVLRYYLSDAWANTGNVSVTKGTAPGYGIDPKETAYGTAYLTQDAKSASMTFVNEKSRFDGYSHNSSVKNTIPVTFSSPAGN